MAFTSKDVMDLRQRTGVGMMDCKNALTETDGDLEKAVEYLREKGIAKAAKKASRVASEGVVCAVVEGGTGVLLEVNCETDFVSRGDQFKALSASIAAQVLKNAPKHVEALLEEQSIGDKSKTVKDVVTDAVAQIGENISVRRFERYEAKGSIIDSYIHLGGKVGVLIEVASDKNTAAIKTLIHDIALQIAAMKPEFVSQDSVSKDTLEKEREIQFALAKNEHPEKPDNIIANMVNGRIKKYFEEACLLDQKFFKETDKTIGKLVTEVAKAEGAKVEVKRFVRFEMGEGIAKKEDNFADEVNQQLEKMQANRK